MFQETVKDVDDSVSASPSSVHVDKGKESIVFDLSGVWVRKGVFFEDGYLDVPPMEGAHEALREILELYGPSNCYLNSHESNECWLARRWRWITHHGIVGPQGFRKANVHFCAERLEKIEFCRSVGAVAVADDRGEIMSALGALPWRIHKYLYQPREEELKRFPQVENDPHLRKIMNMDELRGAFRELAQVPKAA